jgi:EAL domain-containing protein (putative c-di-GMP-specific phosphodiesterase class I)
MRELWLYDRMNRLRFRNYRAKIMSIAFLGTHLPLLALIVYLALTAPQTWRIRLATLGVTLVATLVGTAITLLLLDHLLRPVLLTARTLRRYRTSRDVGGLPTHYPDEAGTLMADAAHTIAHLESALQTLEYLDGTTGLPNRKRLIEDLAVRFLPQGRCAVCAIRFVQYARLLESLDRSAAEAAARALAARLHAATRDGPLYRVAGAEFALVIEAPASPPLSVESCTATLAALLAACAGSILADGVAIEPLLHAGVALFPDDAGAPETLIDHALAAVALASDEIRVGFHSPGARREAVDRLRLEQELRRALAAEEFVLHFQPVIDLTAGQAVGAEALIRWQHPERGLLAPAQFIPAAEATGLIEPIGLWVIRRACAQLHRWNASGLTGLKLAVNLSARQFRDHGLVRHIDEALRDARIAADQLEIELTETAAMADHEHTRSMFRRLRELGVSIAIDDFGTGFASMSQLRQLPFDKLKIDREFVANVAAMRGSQAICEALISLAGGLGLAVLAEGTETAEEVFYLRSRGCRLYQGYFFSRPVPPAEFHAGLRRAYLSLGALEGAEAPAPRARADAAD